MALALAGEPAGAAAQAAEGRSRPKGGNLPAEISTFVGRTMELQRAAEALAGTRQLSIVGPGGVGKTALAMRLAAGALDEFEGAWLIELDSVQDGAGLALALARTLGLRSSPTEPIRATAAEFIEERRLLLLFDNCEHVAAEVGWLAGELLGACPRLTIMATSREPLGTQGEHIFGLEPLEVPREDDDPEDVLASDSARLLLQRAGEQGVSVEAGPATAANIARICARLEGIPLAIELAAARLRTLSLDDLDRRLREDLRVLRLGAGGEREGRRTLDGLIESSWRLLAKDEQAVLARLAVFDGPFTLDGAEAVASAGDGSIEAGPLVLRLADKSLLQIDANRMEARFRMLQPVREFCLARLRAGGDHAAARAAYRRYYLALTARAQTMLASTRASEWLARLDRDQANIRGAIESGVGEGDSECALRIGVSVLQFWACRELAGEGIELLSAGLRETGTPAPVSLRAKAHSAVALLASGVLGDARRAEPHALEALRLADSTGDADTAAEALTCMSWSESFAGRPAQGLAQAEQALARAGTLADASVHGRLLDAQALALEQLGELDAARAAYEHARELFAQAGFVPGLAQVENHLGHLELGAGELMGAKEHFALGRASAEDAGDGASVAMATLNLALIECLDGHRESARELFLDSLITNESRGDRANVAFSIFGLALTAPDPSLAAELHATAKHRLDELEIVLSALEERMQTEALVRLRDDLGPERFGRALERGRGLRVEDVVLATSAPDAPIAS